MSVATPSAMAAAWNSVELLKAAYNRATENVKTLKREAAEANADVKAAEEKAKERFEQL